MQVNSVQAEIILVQDNANAAALVLQNLGFRILHIGTTISVEGPETLWESVFNVSFVTRKKQILPGIEGGDASYRKAITDKKYNEKFCLLTFPGSLTISSPLVFY